MNDSGIDHQQPALSATAWGRGLLRHFMKLLDRPTPDRAVMNAAAHSAAGLNQRTYARLKTSLRLNLRRQIFLAVCDDLELRGRIVAKLQKDLAPHFVSLNLNLADPNPLAQVSQWLAQRGRAMMQGGTSLGFQILGVEHLTRQPAPVQKRFLTHLQALEYYMPALECTTLLWLPRPWLRSVRQSAPTFWEWHTALFEFEGDPTPARSVKTQPITRIPITKIEAWASPAIAPPWPPTAAASQAMHSAGPLAPTVELELEPVEFDSTEFPTPELVPVAKPDETIWDILTQDLARLNEKIAAEDGTGAIAPPPELESPAPLERPAPAPVAPADPVLAPDPAPPTIAIDHQAPYAALLQTYQTLAVAPSPVVAAPVAEQPAAIAQLAALLTQALAITPDSEQHQSAFASLQRLQHLESQQVPEAALATAYYALGRAYRESIEQGDTAELTLAIAICAHEQTLVRLEETSPLWPDVANDLGNLYWMRSRQVTAADLQLSSLNQAIEAYQLALTTLNPQDTPKTVAMIQNNLGSAYGDLAQYQNPAQNLQKSVEAYEFALQYRSATEEPARYAATQNNLGTACWNLAQHQQPLTYLKRAIAAYQQALHYYTPDTEPLSFAMIQNNLGTAYWNLVQYRQPQSAGDGPTPEQLLHWAIAAYEQASVFRTLEVAPAAYAATQNNLGTAYWDLAMLPQATPPERSDRLQSAITAYEAAIKAVAVMTAQHTHRPALTFDIFATHNNLGLAYYHRATQPHSTLSKGDRQTALEAALRHHLKALQGGDVVSEFHQATLDYVIQTVRTFFHEFGIQGQNIAMSQLPPQLLPEIMRKL